MLYFDILLFLRLIFNIVRWFSAAISLRTHVAKNECAGLFEILITPNNVSIVMICPLYFVKLLRVVSSIEQFSSKFKRNNLIPIAVHAQNWNRDVLNLVDGIKLRPKKKLYWKKRVKDASQILAR